MKRSNRSVRIRNRVFLTLITALILVSLFVSLVKYSYDEAKEIGFENLHLQTKAVKEDIELQMASDMENLQTMASFAAKLYSDGESMEIVMKSFNAIGLIEEVGILFPDNTFTTRVGKVQTTGKLDFREEIEKAPYVSGVVYDVTEENSKIVRSAVPISTADGRVAGILYGKINLETLEKRMLENASSTTTVQIFVIERGNGNFIVNTVNKELKNFDVFEDREFVDGYEYENFRTVVLGGGRGNAAYVSKYMTNTTLYMHYAPLAISNWQIMMAEPEEIVFREAEETGRTMAMVFTAIIIVMGAYLLLLFSGERKDSRLNFISSKIRKLLLGINKQETSVRSALENITTYSNARSSFFVDSGGDDYNYVTPGAREVALISDDRAYLVSKILNRVAKACGEKGTNLTTEKFVANKTLADESPELYRLLKKAKIKRVVFTGIVGKKNHISVLGCINPRRFSGVHLLLEDISVCFSMAIYNKKYLNKTEAVASTDSLTGLFNRMAYKTDLLKLDEKHPTDFSCIYLDVNELHVVNNKYGHATGDGMLLYIANSIREVFLESAIYRIGGDEFLIFTENTPKEEIEDMIEILNKKIESMDYHVSIGMDFRSKNTDTEAMVSNAEKRMYEDKAKYYQSKEHRIIKKENTGEVDRITTGIREFDALLSVLSNRYHGIYCVSLESGKARRILMPAYLNQFSEENDLFEAAFAYYVREMVHPDHQRAMLSFINYEVIKRQLLAGEMPSIEYEKINGDKVILSVYGLSSKENENSETLWVFENKD